MRIDVSSVAQKLSEARQEKVVARMLLAVSRFGPQLRRVSVRLDETPNRLGGTDQRCRVNTWLGPGQEIRAEAINGTVESAVARAAERFAKRVSGALLDGRPPPGADGGR